MHPEDRTILAAVEALESGSDALGGRPRTDLDDTTEETRARIYVEALGLIAYELEPVQPPPGARARLMAVIQGDETQDVREPAPPTEPEPIRLTSLPPAGPAPVREVAPPAPPVRPVTSEISRPPRPTSFTPPPRRVRRPSRWPLALAATLAFLFAGLSGWLYTQLDQQRDTIDALGQQLDREHSRVESAVRQVRRAEADALSMREKFALVTSPAVEASPMRPAGNAPLQPAARGVLFVASDHQHWYLCLHGVAPAPEGKTYKLWFMADGIPVSGGTFTARPGAPVELSSKQMPVGTNGVMVTMEADPEAQKPAGPEVLKAAGVYQLS
jgi:hypothetical protein